MLNSKTEINSSIRNTSKRGTSVDGSGQRTGCGKLGIELGCKCILGGW
jgi:hypothetical protein